MGNDSAWSARRAQRQRELDAQRRERVVRAQRRPWYVKVGRVAGPIVAIWVGFVLLIVFLGGTDEPAGDDALRERVESARLILEQLATVSASSNITAALGDEDSASIQSSGDFDMSRRLGHTAFTVDLKGQLRTAISESAEPSSGGDVIVLSPAEAYFTLVQWQQNHDLAPGGRPWIKVSGDQLQQQADEHGVVIETSLPRGLLLMLDRVTWAQAAVDLDADYPQTNAIKAKASGDRAIVESLVPLPARRLVEAALRGVAIPDDVYANAEIDFSIWIDDTNSPHALQFDATSYYRRVLDDAAALPAVDQATLRRLAQEVSVTGKFQFFGFNEPKPITGPPSEEFSELGA